MPQDFCESKESQLLLLPPSRVKRSVPQLSAVATGLDPLLDVTVAPPVADEVVEVDVPPVADEVEEVDVPPVLLEPPLPLELPPVAEVDVPPVAEPPLPVLVLLDVPPVGLPPP
jgi:hypothetical protein